MCDILLYNYCDNCVCPEFYIIIICFFNLIGNTAGQITDAVLDRASEMLGLKETLTKLYDKEV